MKERLHLLIFSLLLFILSYSYGQTSPAKTDTTEYYKSNYLRYDNRVYVGNVRTVQLSPVGAELGTPLIELNSGDQLMLSFDDMDNDSKTYNYTFIHCDAAWTPSDIEKANYITGYTDEHLDSYRPSFNTIIPYTHYQLIFPTQTMRPMISGNYVLIVYSDYDPAKIVLTRRFMIYEQRVTIDAHIHRATIIDDMKSKQKVDFSVLYPEYKIDNPFDDIKVVITQNDRWDNAITNLKPLFLKDHALDYGYDKENTFSGGNEFRFFDNSSFGFLAEHMYRYGFDSSGTHQSYLEPDKRRSSLRYITEHDINGAFKVHVQDNDAANAADYSNVHFTLPLSEPVSDGNIYVFGGFCQWRYDNSTKMTYNNEDRSYHAEILLKQGFYDYEYVYVTDSSNTADESFIEGSHYETENDYTIYVYHHPIGKRYDMLIGVRKVNSLRG